MSFHRLDNAKDKYFWSVRVNNDIRIIAHRTDGSLLLCYVGHHDKAYDWPPAEWIDDVKKATEGTVSAARMFRQVSQCFGQYPPKCQ